MSAAFQSIESELGSLDRRIRKVRAQHVNKKNTREAVKSFVYRYFGQWRPGLVQDIGAKGSLGSLDAEMQELLRCTQRRAPVGDYRARLNQLRDCMSAVELLIASPSTDKPVRLMEDRHNKILESLKRVCPSAGTSFEQGLSDFTDPYRKSWRGTAVEFREALREVLDTLAPDGEVGGQAGFKLERDAQGPTMKQKAMFILRSRRPKDQQIKTFSEAIDIIEELIGKLVRSVYTRSSVAVHVQMSRDEALRISEYVTVVLTELLEIKE